MNRIDYELGLNNNFSNAEGLKWDYPASVTKCPMGMIPYGDGSACKDRRTTCATSGNAGMVRCKDFVSKDPIKCEGNQILFANGGCRDITTETNNLDMTTNNLDMTINDVDTEMNRENKKGLSMGAKIGIGVGLIALIGFSISAFKKRG